MITIGVDLEGKLIPKLSKRPTRGGLSITSCSFCRKSASEVEKIVQGPSIGICNECVGLAANLCGYSLVESSH